MIGIITAIYSVYFGSQPYNGVWPSDFHQACSQFFSLCSLTNGHIEIHGNPLEDSGVVNTKSH